MHTTAFGKALGKALDHIEYANLAEPLMERIANLAANVAYASAREHAPVGRAEDGDPHPGKLQSAIQKTIEKDGTKITAFVFIEKSEIPYVWRAIVGSKNRAPNGFMEIARDDAFEAIKNNFKTMTQEQFKSVNRG